MNQSLEFSGWQKLRLLYVCREENVEVLETINRQMLTGDSCY